jgi:fumarate hydratase subunit alpha
MKTILATDITKNIKEACIKACLHLPNDVKQALEIARDQESSAVCKDVLNQLLDNAQIASSEEVPICRDTGFTIVFIDMGQDVHIEGDYLEDAVNEGVRQGYEEGYLRKSIVEHPIERINTGDNTPAVIHIRIVPGEVFRVVVAPKGGGSENMSMAKVLPPSAGSEGIIKLVAEVVKNAGSNPCPPIIVGVGIGGTIEMAALLSKKAILRKVGESSLNSIDARLESDLLEAVNNTGVGASGYGGDITALAVNVESYPCHIASLPVAVSIQCHAARHAEFEI